jgi:tetraacyldisaccharide 4'-kinase
MAHRIAEKLERFFVRVLARPGADQGLSRPLRLFLLFLAQLAHLYRAVVEVRHYLYDRRMLRPHELGCQVISVGNLTVGGTGKTPIVEIFARELSREGRRVAILSRGYRKEEPPLFQRIANALTLRERRQPPRIVSDGANLLLDSAMGGDEPYMLATNLPNVAVLVDRNRVKSGRYAIQKLGCDTLILDDGFQYLKLKHRIEIVLVDRTNPFGNGYVLPRGILREPPRHIARADFIFITKSEGAGGDALKSQLRKLNPRAELIECRHAPRHLQNAFTRERLDLSFLRGRKVLTLCGIAAPGGFEQEVERRGALVLDRRRFADHHRYSQQELIDIVNRAHRLGADAVVTTEKDTVRFPRLERCDVPILFLRVDIEMVSGVEDFHACIARICFRDRRTAVVP